MGVYKVTDLILGGEHTIQYTDDALWNYIPKTCIILLTNVTPINVIKTNEQINKSH